MNKGISTEIRKILSDWSTISDVMDTMPADVKEKSVMQMISRMKRNGEVVSRDIDLYGRTVKSYKMSNDAG
jgi:hypothetical protein